MKKFVFIAISFILISVMIIPATAAVPDPWFELGYNNGLPVDNQGNLEVKIQSGEVIATTVTYEDVEYTVTAFVGNEDQEGMLVSLPFEDVASYGEWLLGGCTFELFIQLEDLTEGTSGFFTCVNSGGASLYYRNGGDGVKQIQFQIGTTDTEGADNTWGAYAGAAASSASDGPGFIESGKIIHCVGTYNKDTNMLSVYYNGELVSSGSYGNGEFNIGNAYEDVLGIGLNPAYPSESLGVGCEFKIVGAKLYKVALTDAQVAEEYANSINFVKGITNTEVIELESAAADEPETDNIPAITDTAETPLVKAPQTSDFSVMTVIAAIISLIFCYVCLKKRSIN